MKQISYYDLVKDYSYILNNHIMQETANITEWELYAGCDYEYDEEADDYYYPDVYQQYIIDSNLAYYLREYTEEVVWYSEDLDMYLWDIHHYGTSWTHVYLTVKEYNDIHF